MGVLINRNENNTPSLSQGALTALNVCVCNEISIVKLGVRKTQTFQIRIGKRFFLLMFSHFKKVIGNKTKP